MHPKKGPTAQDERLDFSSLKTLLNWRDGVAQLVEYRIQNTENFIHPIREIIMPILAHKRASDSKFPDPLRVLLSQKCVR